MTMQCGVDVPALSVDGPQPRSSTSGPPAKAASWTTIHAVWFTWPPLDPRTTGPWLPYARQLTRFCNQTG